MFVDRLAELAFLDSVLERKRPTEAQLILMYGRQRVGKTVLLRHWADHSRVDHTYWAAEKEPAALQRRKLFVRLLGVETSLTTTFDSWADCWQVIAAFIVRPRSWGQF
jgi:AAA+ ATPase superfamily predicted ATPase